MGLAAIWYISAIIANGAMILLLVYIAILATVCWLERHAAIRRQERAEIERFRNKVGR